MRITDEHIAIWRQRGYVVVEGFLLDDEIAAGLADIHKQLPTWDEFAANSARYPWRDSGFALHEFPFAGSALNRISVHPEIVSFLERALGRRDLFMTQSLLWAKYAGVRDFDQPLHFDYEDNTLLVPNDARPQVPMILYYTDVTAELGPTHVVSREVSDDRPLVPAKRTKDDDPELYEHEVAVTVPAGSLLVFTMRTFHRGSAFRAHEGLRFAQHLVFRICGSEFQGWRAFPRYADGPEMAAFMVGATPRQRELIGVPPPGDDYWEPATIAAVAERYPGIDMTPYRASAGLVAAPS